MIVMKFGGTSVQNAQAIAAVAGIVRGRQAERPFVVVSALAKVTRELLALARSAAAGDSAELGRLLAGLKERHFALAEELLSGNQGLREQTQAKLQELFSSLEAFSKGVCLIRELSPRSEARIISFGELLSSTIIAAYFNSSGLSCSWLDARELIVTDESYLSAGVLWEPTASRVRSAAEGLPEATEVVVTQGFIAADSKGFTSVLGFEGSDYSAALFARALEAEAVEIWTDVDGIRTADPRRVSGTQRVPVISCREASVMAALGARVLHPLTMEPARLGNIPLRVRNTGRPEGEGSLVSAGEAVPKGHKSVAYVEDVLLVSLEDGGQRGVSALLSAFFGAGKDGLRPLLLCASERELQLTFKAEDRAALEERLRLLPAWVRAGFSGGKAQLSVIGSGLFPCPGLDEEVARLAGTVYLAARGAGLLSESFVIDASALDRTLSGVHSFLLSFRTGA